MINNVYVALLQNSGLSSIYFKNLSIIFIQLKRWRHYHNYAWLGKEPMETYLWDVQKERRLHHCWYEWQGKPDCCCKLWQWSCRHHMSTSINLRISVYYSFNYFLIFFQIQKYFLLLIRFVIFLYNSNLQFFFVIFTFLLHF